LEIFGGRAPSLGAPREPEPTEYRRGSEPTQISGEYPPHHPRPTALEERPHQQ